MSDWGMGGEAPIICYGDDGPAFARVCPKCGRFLRFPKGMTWREDFTGRCTFPTVDCSRCGPVEPDHIGWAGDFR